MASGFSANGMEVDSAIDDEEDDCGSLSSIMDIRLKSSEDIRHCWETASKRRNREWGTSSAPTSSVVSWCQASNSIACSTASSVDTRKRWGQAPFFYIPVHLVDPSRPNEHTVLRVRSDSPSSTMQILAWSPLSCPRALLTMDSKGCGSVWTQPSQGGANVARAVNVWHCEYKWRQEPAILVKWLAAPSPYCWSGETVPKKSYAERFMSMEPRTPCRWPRAGFLCFVAVTASGFLQLHWRQWPPPAFGDPWCSTQLTALVTGSGGLTGADVIVTRAGSVLVAALPANQSATVIVMELVPLIEDERARTSAGPGSFRSKISYYLQSWQDPASQSGQSLQAGASEQRTGPPIQCVVLSSLSTFLVPPQPQEPMAMSTSSTYGPEGISHDGPGGGRNVEDAGAIPEQQLAAVAFDPIEAGSSLVTMTFEGKRGVKSPQPQAALSGGSEAEKKGPGFRIEKWEIEKQNVSIHKVFGGPVGGNYTPPDVPVSMVWKMQANRWVESSGGGTEWGGKGNTRPGAGSKDREQEVSHGSAEGVMAADGGAGGEQGGQTDNEVSSSVEGEHSSAGFANLEFSMTGAEFSLAIRGGEIHLFSRHELTYLGFLTVPATSLTPGVAFSPNGCCITTIWRDSRSESLVGSLLKIAQVPVQLQESTALGGGKWGGGGGISAANPGNTLEKTIGMWNRHLADRATWSFATDTNWWDVIISAHSCAEEGTGTLGGMTAILDEGFQALGDKEYFSLVLDRFKCSLLEGVEVQDVRALVIDMQARLLLDHVGKSLETMLLNPTALEPKMSAGADILQPEATALHPAMVTQMHSYVDTILDLLWHFLTWLRRYGDFCRGDAANVQQGSQRLAGQSAGVATSGQTGWNTDTATTGTMGAGGVNGTVGSMGGASTETAGAGGERGVMSSAGPGGGEVGGPIQSGPSQVPAVRLAGDRYFLTKLLQLAYFSYFFRKAYPLPPLGGSRLGGSDQQRGAGAGDSSKPNVKEEVVSTKPARSGNGNAGQGYSNEEVKMMYFLLSELSKKTSNLPASAWSSQIQAGSVGVRLHYAEGHVLVSADIVGQVFNTRNAHTQMQRPRGTDAAGVLMRELELHPPIEDVLRRGTGRSAGFLAEDVLAGRLLLPEKDLSMWADSGGEELELGRAWERAEVWSRKRRFAERDAAFGMASSSTLAEYSGLLGCRRDVVAAVWKSSPNVCWHRCTRCGRHTAALVSANTMSGQNVFSSNGLVSNEGEAKDGSRTGWHYARWVFGCPICGGHWIKVL